MSTYSNFVLATLRSIKSKGVGKTMKELLTLSQARDGKLIGVDKFGNEYYENREDMHGRDRWVNFKKWDFDASQVPPEWHQWLHRMTDDLPSDKTLPKPFFGLEHRENMTGTRGAFKTYNTTVPKLSAWEPQTKARQ
ncbi:NADH ubiquinone oxidoreductase subunit NDUFA12-domain-containing protein [Entophlyctis helioformis]|nr:NADH ubiquinone oxidoreductase subunit NDUFA12-domain-containing protein [Entophlyctis helioformis]